MNTESMKIYDKCDETLVDKLLNIVLISNQLAFIKRFIAFKPEISPILLRQHLIERERFKGQSEAEVVSTLSKNLDDDGDFINTFNWLELAATLVYKIATKHAFIDGNKRTALNTGILILMTQLPSMMKAKIDFQSLGDFIVNIVDKSQTSGNNSQSLFLEIEKKLFNTLFNSEMTNTPEFDYKPVSDCAKELMENQSWTDLMKYLQDK